MSTPLESHLRDVASRIESWLADRAAADRIDALVDLKAGIEQLHVLMRTVRRDTIAELVDEHGLETVADLLDATPDEVLGVLAQPVRRRPQLQP